MHHRREQSSHPRCTTAICENRSVDAIPRLDADRALAIVRSVASAAAGPVSVVVSDDHGEPIASLRMDGAALDSYENARRKAYTAARSDQSSTRALAEKLHAAPTELASFDPAFSFFLGGVAVRAGGRRLGAVGVSGLPGPDDEALAAAAIAAAGFDPHP
jgi:glc operon protein GlcG